MVFIYHCICKALSLIKLEDLEGNIPFVKEREFLWKTKKNVSFTFTHTAFQGGVYLTSKE